MKNQLDINYFNYISSIFLGIVFLCLNLSKGNNKLIFTFLILCFFIYIFNKKKQRMINITDSILYSIIASFIIYHFSKMNNKKISEGFSSNKKEEETNEEEEKPKKKIIKKKNKKESFSSEDDSDNESDDDEPYIDAGSTFLKAYKKLDKKQLEGMTNDTKELISTQKNLMETIKNLSPVITEGRKVLDTFTNYFDN